MTAQFGDGGTAAGEWVFAGAVVALVLVAGWSLIRWQATMSGYRKTAQESVDLTKEAQALSRELIAATRDQLEAMRDLTDELRRSGGKAG